MFAFVLITMLLYRACRQVKISKLTNLSSLQLHHAVAKSILTQHRSMEFTNRFK